MTRATKNKKSPPSLPFVASTRPVIGQAVGSAFSRTHLGFRAVSPADLLQDPEVRQSKAKRKKRTAAAAAAAGGRAERGAGKRDRHVNWDTRCFPACCIVLRLLEAALWRTVDRREGPTQEKGL